MHKQQFKQSSELSQTSTSSIQTPNNLPNSCQNDMFRDMGQTTSNNTKKPTKNEKSTSKLFHAQTGSIWFQIFLRGSYLVPTVFDRSDGCSYKLKSHLFVLMHMQCSKIGLKMLFCSQDCCLCTKHQSVKARHASEGKRKHQKSQTRATKKYKQTNHKHQTKNRTTLLPFARQV